MTDLSQTIVPKSDQLNSDDLIGKTMTIEITGVSMNKEPEQPISISFKGDNKKPYKPGKSMRRVLVQVWGADGNAYVGRSMTLYRDEKVIFGGVAVGGIRISHMSHIDRDITMALTASKAQRKPFTVRPLVAEEKKRTWADLLEDITRDFNACKTSDEVEVKSKSAEIDQILSGNNEKVKAKLVEIIEHARDRFSENEPTLPKPWPIPDIEACLSESDLMRLQNSTAYVTALPTLSVDVMKQVTEAVADAHRRFG